jgi:hypothetical protein
MMLVLKSRREFSNWHFSYLLAIPLEPPHLAKANFLSALSVAFAVAIGTNCNQVVYYVPTELTPWFHVMDLQVFHGTAFLTAPTIPL